MKLRVTTGHPTTVAFLRAALRGLHATTNEAMDLRAALEDHLAALTQGRVSDDAIAVAYAREHTIAGTARALGIARSTVRERLARIYQPAVDGRRLAANDG